MLPTPPMVAMASRSERPGPEETTVSFSLAEGSDGIRRPWNPGRDGDPSDEVEREGLGDRHRDERAGAGGALVDQDGPVDLGGLAGHPSRQQVLRFGARPFAEHLESLPGRPALGPSAAYAPAGPASRHAIPRGASAGGQSCCRTAAGCPRT